MIKILLHHILIKLDDAIEADGALKRAKAAGLILELDSREQAAVEYGTVVKIGPTAYIAHGLDPTILKVGDRVSFTRYSGKRIVDSDGVEYMLLNDDDVLVVIE